MVFSYKGYLLEPTSSRRNATGSGEGLSLHPRYGGQWGQMNIPLSYIRKLRKFMRAFYEFFLQLFESGRPGSVRRSVRTRPTPLPAVNNPMITGQKN